MSLGTLEYLYTAGILVAFIGLLAGTVLDRKNIWRVLREHSLTRNRLLLAFAIAAVFVVVELALVKPTQLLFFDDAIYQGMAQDLLHMGQAWFCDYGTPTYCYSGELFHEPIGLSFNFAIAFAIFGVKLSAAQGAELALAAIAVFMSFPAALLLLKDTRAAYFSELLMALSPIILVWAMPTNSDMAVLAYSLIALFFLLVFMKRKSAIGLMNVLLAVALSMYMKVPAALYAPVFALMYLILDDKSISGSIRTNFKRIKKYVLETKVLVVLLIFVLALAPAINYAGLELSSGNYGVQGSLLQNTCDLSKPAVTATGNLDLMNFQFNICSNVLFWLDQYKSTYIMQPVIFTALALIGVVAMAFFPKRRELLAIGIWFLSFFVFYTAFYAGSVVFGVDWRFMLSLIAQASILGGFGVSSLVNIAAGYVGAKGRSIKRNVVLAASVIAVIVIFYPIYALGPMLSVSPASIPQAPDARFYEGFVYNESRAIPTGCLVFSYDPTLFNINNRTADQIGDLYNAALYQNFTKQYSCLVFDYGYWCHTPNNGCKYVNQTYTLSPLKVVTFSQFGYTYGLYYITGKRNASG